MEFGYFLAVVRDEGVAVLGADLRREEVAFVKSPAYVDRSSVLVPPGLDRLWGDVGALGVNPMMCPDAVTWRNPTCIACKSGGCIFRPAMDSIILNINISDKMKFHFISNLGYLNAKSIKNSRFYHKFIECKMELFFLLIIYFYLRI